MVLASVVSTSQTGSIELLATQLNNPPSLANNSGSTVTVSLTATGQWALINFATSDPNLAKYKTPVDGNGHVRDKNDEKFGFKYPNLNPGALVGEIKDAKGNTKSTVSGKQQSFELQPGDTVSFVINDDPKWYADNTGKLTIAYSVTAKATDTVRKGKIVVNCDEWTLCNAGFRNSPDAATFAINIAKYFVGEAKGKFHALSTHNALVESSLEQTLTQAGHTWTKGTNITVDLATLSKYDGIFLAGDPVDNQVLIQYVKNGGKVYLAAGTGWGGAQPEADRWNTFLGEFGLKFAGQYDGTSGNLSPNQSHPLFAGVKSLYFHSGNPIIDLKPESPLNEIIQSHEGRGLIATAEFDPTAPRAIANLYNTGVDDARQVLGDSIEDPHYKLKTYPGATEIRGVTTPNKEFPNWVANTKTARWIGPNTAFAVGPVGDYSYTTTFTLPRCSEALIVGELSADDRITDILINGVSLGNPLPLSSWTTISKLSISKGFVVGTNTIEFKLHNSNGPTGLRIDSISGTYRPSSNKWVGTRLDNQKPEVFTWVDPFWHEIIDGQTIKNNFKEVSNNYSTVVIDQGFGPVFLTADGAYWKGKRFAVGAFEFAVGLGEFAVGLGEFSKHETWSGQRPANGGTVAYQFNKATGFWEEANNGVVTKNNFKEVENNKATVTIDQGFGPVYLTLDGAYYNGTKFASGNFGGK